MTLISVNSLFKILSSVVRKYCALPSIADATCNASFAFSPICFKLLALSNKAGVSSMSSQANFFHFPIALPP